MAQRTFSGMEIAKALDTWHFERVGQTGSHLELRYVDPNTDEKRTLVVPLHDELDTGTLKGIAEQAGANDFQSFLDEMEAMV